MNQIKKYTGLIALSIGLFCSCQDAYLDEHYSWNGTAQTRNLMDVMKADTSLSSFCQVLKNQGLDSLIATDQSFTVWAPDNNAMAGYVEDANTIGQFLKNHINRFLFSPSDLTNTSSLRIKMLDGKFQEYAKWGSAYTFAGISMSNQSKMASNGIVHVLSQRVPFYFNMYESIKQPGNNTDSIANFLKSFDVYTFNLSASTAIGKNAQGKLVYDSVFDYRNNWMRKYGYAYLEDSLYTMIAPTNSGWIDNHSKVSKYFKTFGNCITSSVNAINVPTRTYKLNDALADSLTRAYTLQNMCKDLFFRTKSDPMSAPGDSLISTSGSILHQASAIFDGATRETVSNGFIWKSDVRKQNPMDCFLKTIRVEAENTTNRTDFYATVTTRSATNTNFRDSVSNLRYIEVVQTTTSTRTQPTVQFSVPNTLAAKYNVYVVFAPASAYMTGVTADSVRVNFFLNYVHADGTMKEDAVISGSITNGYKMTKMFVKQIVLPFSNYSASPFSGPKKQDADAMKLRIQANVGATETTKLTRTMRIDCILLEPVNE
ncbi:MAG TPA: fasciclin domain-containing protein [Bacteroidales bacterium]|nr:fasciclin domain-containing protein [Bacteroidales bacterium]